ncbi:hypothetical protein CR970_04240 [Candidatus Saccharibacteria bacterium]|nr:MAG: hypothetical protein CR970_04240 [Candidatus Saccharibacteria bacterium]
MPTPRITSRKLFILALAQIGLGLVLFATYAYTTARQQALAATPVITPLVNITPAEQPKTTIAGHPVRVRIPALGLDLPVGDGSYDTTTNNWTLSNHSTYYALPTAQPNNHAGNTLIYGHRLPNIFGNLHTLRPGTVAEVYTDNGYLFRYMLDSSESVSPTDLSIFTYQGPPRLTLQTCSGAFDSERRLQYFSLESVTKNTQPNQ